MFCMTVIRVGCLAACAAVARCLHVGTDDLPQPLPTRRSVLILGCSVDRIAIENFCMKADKYLRVGCYDKERSLAIGFIFHPGVGMNGDLQPPFYNSTRYGSYIPQPVSSSKHLYSISRSLLKSKGMETQFPDLVVVDSSLWDLATWASWSAKNLTEERLRQWGDSDLKNLLTRVSETFPESRVVFRTPPAVYKTKFVSSLSENRVLDVATFSADGVHQMYSELNKHVINGMLYGKYEVLDYNKIMDDLIKERGFVDPKLWLQDGYHPSKEPSRRYVNHILQLMNMTAVEKEDPTRQGTPRPPKKKGMPPRQPRPQTRLPAAPSDDVDDLGELLDESPDDLDDVDDLDEFL